MEEKTETQRILVFNLYVDTEDDHNFHLKYSITGKLLFIHEALGDIKLALSKQEEKLRKEGKKAELKKLSDQKVRAILVAPEYFFARACPEYYSFNRTSPARYLGNRHSRHYDYEQYIEIRKGLTFLSTEYPNVLIIPGTVAWKRQAVEALEKTYSSDSSYSNFSPVPSWPEGFRHQSFKAYKDEMEPIGEKVTQQSWLDYQRETPDSELNKACESLNSMFGNNYGGQGVSPSEKRSSMTPYTKPQIQPQALVKALKGCSKFELAYNTALFYLKGKKVGEYSKHSDYQEVLRTLGHPNPELAVPGIGSPVMRIGGINIGVEICLDHDYQILKGHINAGKLPKPDIHLLLSAKINTQYQMIGSGGLFIHSSSYFEYNSIRTDKLNPQNRVHHFWDYFSLEVAKEVKKEVKKEAVPLSTIFTTNIRSNHGRVQRYINDVNAKQFQPGTQ